jgi:hypothetical protein
MKKSRKMRLNRNRVSRKKNNKYNFLGGSSHHGVRIALGDVSTLDRFANYWNEFLRRNVWYSTGQEGYYFSNLQNFYMSKTHTHIYRIDDLDEDKKKGKKKVYYTTKIKNQHIEKNATVNLNYLEIATWLTKKNEEIGADGYIDPIPISEQ